jgi:hypothetical protein
MHEWFFFIFFFSFYRAATVHNQWLPSICVSGTSLTRPLLRKDMTLWTPVGPLDTSECVKRHVSHTTAMICASAALHVKAMMAELLAAEHGSLPRSPATEPCSLPQCYLGLNASMEACCKATCVFYRAWRPESESQKAVTVTCRRPRAAGDRHVVLLAGTGSAARHAACNCRGCSM